VLQGDPYVVTDARLDIRTVNHPLVRGEFGLRFYAAAPIVTASGHRLGTVSVVDREPREVIPTQTSMLTALTAIVTEHLELRLATLAAVRAEQQLRADVEEWMVAPVRLANQLRAAPIKHRHGVGFPDFCQLGGAAACGQDAELKVADAWGDSAWDAYDTSKR
jgi:GAF domain-containing protein